MKKSLKLITLLLFMLVVMVILGCAKSNNHETTFSPSDKDGTSSSGSENGSGYEKPVVFGWKKNTSHAAFTARYKHQVVVFKGKLYLIGGIGEKKGKHDEPYNDVWSSTDGISWQKENQDTKSKFTARGRHQVVVFENQMYLIYGTTGGIDLVPDIYSSNDGIRWDILYTDPIGLSDHQVAVFKDELYLIGDENSDPENNVWSSTNGKDWTKKVEQKAYFSSRSDYQVVVFNNKMYLIGGIDSQYKALNDIWSSTDGVHWKKETDNAPFSARYGHQVVVFKNKIYLIGGNSDNYKNDIWSSIDGKDWKEETAGAPFPARYGHQVVVFKNKIYLIGGINCIGKFNDVWSYGALDEK
jgi:hypothetical protein